MLVQVFCKRYAVAAGRGTDAVKFIGCSYVAPLPSTFVRPLCKAASALLYSLETVILPVKFQQLSQNRDELSPELVVFLFEELE